MNEYEKIETYLQGEMTAEEQQQFQQQIQADTQLAAQLDVYRQAHIFLQNEPRINLGEAALRNTINHTINQQTTPQATPAKVVSMQKRWIYTAIAAAACIAMFFILRPVLFNTGSNPQQLYSQYAGFEEFSNTRGNNDVDTMLQAGKEQFNKKNYNTAITLFTSHLSMKPNDTYIQLARAFAYMETGKYPEAETELLQIEAGATGYAIEATWYRALLLLKQNKKDDCKKLLQTLIRDDSTNERAKKLLSEL